MAESPEAADVAVTRPYLFLGSRLKRLAERMQSDVDRVAERAGIAVLPGQNPVLASLEHGPRAIGDIARVLGLSQPAATRAVGRLEASGLVAVGGNAEDRRQRRVSLSPAGRALLERSQREIWPLVEAAVRETVGDLTGPLLDQIARIEARLAERPLSERAAAAAVRLEEAAADDLPAVVALMNRAYRDPHGSWTNEAAYIDGDRASVGLLAEEIAASPDGRLLLWRRGADLLGCVRVEPEEEGDWYLGALTVDPAAQNAGLGRRLLTAAEDWIGARGGHVVRMTVVNVRDTLIAWYLRRGYDLTGETLPFPYEDDRFGVPRQDDLAFVVLHKRL